MTGQDDPPSDDALTTELATLGDETRNTRRAADTASQALRERLIYAIFIQRWTPYRAGTAAGVSPQYAYQVAEEAKATGHPYTQCDVPGGCAA